MDIKKATKEELQEELERRHEEERTLLEKERYDKKFAYVYATSGIKKEVLEKTPKEVIELLYFKLGGHGVDYSSSLSLSNICNCKIG